MSSSSALLLAALLLLAPFEARAATWPAKSSGARLKRVSQSLETIAGRTRSTRYVSATGEVAVGGLATLTGVGLIVGSVKYGANPNRARGSLYSSELGHAFVDAYTRVPGEALGIAVGAVLTYTGVGLLSSGANGFFHPSEAESFYFDRFATTSHRSEKEIAEQADLGEAKLKELAEAARKARVYYGWQGLVCGALIVAAATAEPEAPLPFFIGGAAGVFGLVSLLSETPTEEEYGEYEAWRTGVPRETASLRLAAFPARDSLALGLTLKF